MRLVYICVFFSYFYSCCVISAGIFTDKTRVIFSSESKNESIQFYNENNYPVLVQSWIDNGFFSSDIQNEKLSLAVVPPLLRIQPKESKGVRIFKNNTTSLPNDRESIFWLNYQIIPPYNPELESKRTQSIDFSVRMRMKIFYRPVSLKKQEKDWPLKIKCFMKASETHRMSAFCSNPTPFFATLDQVSFTNLQKKYYSNNFLLEPFSAKEIPLIFVAINSTKVETGIKYSVIDDRGFVVDF